MAQAKLSNEQIERNKTEKMMITVAKRAGYYRKNLDKFCIDYLGITNLKWFQKVLLWAMDTHDNTLLIACRG